MTEKDISNSNIEIDDIISVSPSSDGENYNFGEQDLKFIVKKSKDHCEGCCFCNEYAPEFKKVCRSKKIYCQSRRTDGKRFIFKIKDGV